MTRVNTISPSILTPPDLIPVRMLNEFTYCPRLCYLEWIEQEWNDNAYTLEGTYHHRRVDRETGDLPDSEAKEEDSESEIKARSVEMSAPSWA